MHTNPTDPTEPVFFAVLVSTCEGTALGTIHRTLDGACLALDEWFDRNASGHPEPCPFGWPADRGALPDSVFVDSEDDTLWGWIETVSIVD